MPNLDPLPINRIIDQESETVILAIIKLLLKFARLKPKTSTALNSLLDAIAEEYI